ncbi:MAG: hypothetical protein MHM6MM_005564 [Cercozoa sp. M6MM]
MQCCLSRGVTANVADELQEKLLNIRLVLPSCEEALLVTSDGEVRAEWRRDESDPKPPQHLLSLLLSLRRASSKMSSTLQQKHASLIRITGAHTTVLVASAGADQLVVFLPSTAEDARRLAEADAGDECRIALDNLCDELRLVSQSMQIGGMPLHREDSKGRL